MKRSSHGRRHLPVQLDVDNVFYASQRQGPGGCPYSITYVVLFVPVYAHGVTGALESMEFTGASEAEADAAMRSWFEDRSIMKRLVQSARVAYPVRDRLLQTSGVCRAEREAAET